MTKKCEFTKHRKKRQYDMFSQHVQNQFFVAAINCTYVPLLQWQSKGIICGDLEIDKQTLFIIAIKNVILYCRKLFYESKFLCDSQLCKVGQIDVCSKQWNLSLWTKMIPWQTQKMYKNRNLTIMVKYRIMEDSWTIHKKTICYHVKLVFFVKKVDDT